MVQAAAYLPAQFADPEEARKLLEVNAFGTFALLKSSVRTSVRKVVVFSSNMYRHGTEVATEEASAYPSVHAPFCMMGKLCAEVWADHFDWKGKLQTASLRAASVYGPGFKRGMIPTLTATLVQAKPIIVKDGGRYPPTPCLWEMSSTRRRGAVARRARNSQRGPGTTPLDVARACKHAVVVADEKGCAILLLRFGDKIEDLLDVVAVHEQVAEKRRLRRGGAHCCRSRHEATERHDRAVRALFA